MIACNGEESKGNESAEYQKYKTEINNKTVMELIETLPEKYTEVKLFEIKWGTGDDELGYIPGDGACGPQGIALDTLGNIYILDYCNGAVKKYNEEGFFLEKYEDGSAFVNINYIEVSEDGRQIFAVLEGKTTNNIYIYDTKNKEGNNIYQGKEYVYKRFSHGVEILKDNISIKKYGVEREKNKEDNNYLMQYTLGKNTDKVSFVSDRFPMAQFLDKDYDRQESFPVCFIGIDSKNNYFISARYYEKSTDDNNFKEVIRVVYKYTSNMKLKAVIILERGNINYINRTIKENAKINEDGDIYYLCPKKEGAVIYKYVNAKASSK